MSVSRATFKRESLPDADPPEGRGECVGVRATVELQIPSGAGGFWLQSIDSPGLWGIEANADPAYLDEVFREESDTLADMLTTMGLVVVP